MGAIPDVGHWTFEVRVYDEMQAPYKYLVIGYADILWTDDIEEALTFIRKNIEEVTS